MATGNDNGGILFGWVLGTIGGVISSVGGALLLDLYRARGRINLSTVNVWRGSDASEANKRPFLSIEGSLRAFNTYAAVKTIALNRIDLLDAQRKVIGHTQRCSISLLSVGQSAFDVDLAPAQSTSLTFSFWADNDHDQTPEGLDRAQRLIRSAAFARLVFRVMPQRLLTHEIPVRVAGDAGPQGVNPLGEILRHAIVVNGETADNAARGSA